MYFYLINQLIRYTCHKITFTAHIMRFYVRFHWLDGLCLILFKDKHCFLNKLLFLLRCLSMCRFIVNLILCLSLVILPFIWNTFQCPVHVVFIECWQLCSFTEVISEPVVICNSWRAGLVLICSLHPLRNALHVRQEYMLV